MLCLDCGADISERDIRTKRCKPCARKRNKSKERQWKLNNPEKIREWNRLRYIANGDKMRDVNAKYRARNGKKRRDYNRKYHLVNAERINERIRKWAAENPEKRRAAAQIYNQNNPGKRAARWAKYRCAKINATPSWADHEAIREIYKRAAEEGMTVDHIIPLQGDNVCGLHVENNLQLLPMVENSRKGHKFTWADN
jgi:hypothetical protein